MATTSSNINKYNLNMIYLSSMINELVPKLENNNGLAIFVENKAKFEGWLKVELCGILSKYFSTVIPEKDRIDIVFNDWAMELKTVNTNYEFENVVNKTCPITENIGNIISDIEKLKSTPYPNKAIVFVVFPVKHNNSKWKEHLAKIEKKLNGNIMYREFNFKNGVPGVIYFGLV